MIKDLSMEKKANKIIINVDDLKFDGKDLIIPSYWTSVVIDYLNAVDEKKIKDADKEDFNCFKKFFYDVNSYKEERYSEGN